MYKEGVHKKQGGIIIGDFIFNENFGGKKIMKDRYEIFCLVNDDSYKSIILLDEEEEKYQIKFKMDDFNILGEAGNYFYALIELRKKLEEQNIKLLCKGCSRYVYPSPMILSMGDAIEAYELTLGKQAYTKDLVNIFEPCKCEEYASIAEQYDYYKKWIESKKE